MLYSGAIVTTRDDKTKERKTFRSANNLACNNHMQSSSNIISLAFFYIKIIFRVFTETDFLGYKCMGEKCIENFAFIGSTY